MTDLEKASAVDRILEILDTFDKEVKPTEKLLKVSEIGNALVLKRDLTGGFVGDQAWNCCE